jgi:hypothetical protein
MASAKPFGNPERASILVIGHDPRLQRSKAEAEYVFFLDYLLRPLPSQSSEVRKYGLANGLLNYVSHLAGQRVPLSSLYVTNLCNEFLPSTQGGGTVLIPNDKAETGVAAIQEALSKGSFDLILPTSQQVNYHLARLDFFDEKSSTLDEFVKAAAPKPGKAAIGVYTYAGEAPFLKICGQRLHHHGIPTVPVLHVKQWPLRKNAQPYTEPMEQARRNVSSILEKVFREDL